jgi:CubicO group peptidase (beta-lactamase class C family)
VTRAPADVRLEQVLQRETGRSVPGLSVLAADADRVLVDRCSGIADLVSGVAMSRDAACNWFSLTKLVTATAAVQLSDRGRLDLDAPVVDVYEPFAAMEPTARARSVTTRHLLSHASGVANPLPTRWVHRANEPGPEPSVFVESVLAKHRKLRADPGERAVYSNLGYLVIGEVVSRVAGRPYTEYVRTEILQPLGMTRTGFVIAPGTLWARGSQRRASTLGVLLPLFVPRSTIASRHGAFRTLHHFYVDGAAYGGLVGPPSDAIRFARAHLGDGQLDGARVLSADRTREMREVVARGRRFEVGLGWFRRGRRPGPHLEHLGGGAGFWSCLRLEPERGLAVVTMGNATKYDHDALAVSAAATANQLGISDPRGSISDR